MAKKATKAKAKPKTTKAKVKNAANSAGDTVMHLLQSPLVAELVAVAATAAIASFAATGTEKARKSGKNAIKAAGVAAAAALGSRLTEEFDAIRDSAKKKKA